MSNRSTKRNIAMSRNVYVDNNRLIYYDPFTKKAHQITKGDEKTFVFFQMGTPAAFIIGGLIAYYTGNYYLAIGVGAAVALAVYGVFRFVYIAKLPEYPKFQVPEKAGIISSYIENNSATKLLTNAAVMAVLGVMVIINSVTQKYDGMLGLLNYAVGGCFLLAGLILFYAFIKKKK